MTNSRDSLREAALQDVPLSMLQEQFQDVRGRNTAICDAEYGTRADDGALVFHFFPPGYAADASRSWSSWFVFRDSLETAALNTFAPENIYAGYAEELKSFWLIVKPRPMVPDLTALIELFFRRLEYETQTASESSP